MTTVAHHWRQWHLWRIYGSGRGGGAVVLAAAGGMCTSGVQVLRGGAGEAAEMRLYGGVRACGNYSSQRSVTSPCTVVEEWSIDPTAF